jgi:hypothetical protein
MQPLAAECAVYQRREDVALIDILECSVLKDNPKATCARDKDSRKRKDKTRSAV